MRYPSWRALSSASAWPWPDSAIGLWLAPRSHRLPSPPPAPGHTSGLDPGQAAAEHGDPRMLHFGGTITLNGLVSYASYNFEKVLLGRF
jgi:hypothetical protein